MHINPLSDVVVVKRSPPEEMSEGGIALVFDEDHREDIGIVEFVGKGKLYGCPHCNEVHRRPVSVLPGQKVLFSTNGHQITTLKGEEFVVLREPSIIGVIE